MISRGVKNRVNCHFIKTVKPFQVYLSQSSNTIVKFGYIRDLLVSVEDPEHCGSLYFSGVAGRGKAGYSRASSVLVDEYI